MTSPAIPLCPARPGMYADRLGVAKLTKMAYAGLDLNPLYSALARACRLDTEGAGSAMDLSMLVQLMGDQQGGLAIQSRILDHHRLYRSACTAAQPRLRVLAFAADMDIGGNTPLEFLLEDSAIELLTLYLVPGMPLPEELPDHDIAIVTVPDDGRCKAVLRELERLVPVWPRPVLNLPEAIARLDRDRLHVSLQSIPGLRIPLTQRLPRARIEERLAAIIGDEPLVIRPVGSHAGRDLAKFDHHTAISGYLRSNAAEEFFVSPYVDYRSADGLFRKYRIVLVDGKAFASHMAISDQWKIWYLNADMAESAAKRAEEQVFMEGFETGFAARHAHAIAEFHRRIGLDYVGIDCAETPAGELLVFEADNTLIVHDMDPPDIFPYKLPHMHKLFAAFQEMLHRLARQRNRQAA